MNTNYKLRLKSGRIVEPGPGGFYWFWARGDGAGHIGDFDALIARMAANEMGSVGVANRTGSRDSITEFIPADQLETVVRNPAEEPVAA